MERQSLNKPYVRGQMATLVLDLIQLIVQWQKWTRTAHKIEENSLNSLNRLQKNLRALHDSFISVSKSLNQQRTVAFQRILSKRHCQKWLWNSSFTGLHLPYCLKITELKSRFLLPFKIKICCGLFLESLCAERIQLTIHVRLKQSSCLWRSRPTVALSYGYTCPPSIANKRTSRKVNLPTPSFVIHKRR